MKAIHTQFILLGISSVIFVLLISPCYSQSHRLDSLQALLPGKSDGEHIDILIEISRAYINSDKLKGLDYSRKSYEKAKRFGDSLRIVKAGRLLGQGLRRIGKHDSAQILFKKMLPVAKRNAYKSEIKTILNALGVIYVHTARHDEALKYLFESLDVSEADNDVYTNVCSVE